MKDEVILKLLLESFVKPGTVEEYGQVEKALIIAFELGERLVNHQTLHYIGNQFSRKAIDRLSTV